MSLKAHRRHKPWASRKSDKPHFQDPAFAPSVQTPSDQRRAPQYQQDPFVAPKAAAVPALTINPNLPGLKAIEEKYAAELKRGRELSESFSGGDHER